MRKRKLIFLGSEDSQKYATLLLLFRPLGSRLFRARLCPRDWQTPGLLHLLDRYGRRHDHFFYIHCTRIEALQDALFDAEVEFLLMEPHPEVWTPAPALN